jgi:hypothetical protein
MALRNLTKRVANLELEFILGRVLHQAEVQKHIPNFDKIITSGSFAEWLSCLPRGIRTVVIESQSVDAVRIAMHFYNEDRKRKTKSGRKK